MADVLYIEKIEASDRDAFRTKIIDISNKLEIQPSWLTAVMNSESGMNPKAYNNNGGATGLIQWMPSTAKYFGTTTDALRKMKASEQLDWVYKYFKNYSGRLKSPYDIYLVTFFPAAVGKPDDWVFEAKNLSRSKIAQGNPAIDLNKDKMITVGEFKQWFGQRIKIDYVVDKVSPANIISNTVSNAWNDDKKKVIIIAVGSVIVIGGGVATYLYLTSNK